MDTVRPLVTTATVFLLLGIAAAVVAPVAADHLPSPYAELDWSGTHEALLLWGFLLPALFALHLHTVRGLTGRAVEPTRIDGIRAAVAVATGILALAALGIGDVAGRGAWDAFAALVGGIVLTVAAVLQLGAYRAVRGTETLTRADTPLTRGDDASAKHLAFGHVALPVGLLMLAVAAAPGMPATAAARLHVAGTHIALVMYALLSIYGLGHILVPRFSGVPAIAAGAIKGELHATLLGITGMTVGFLLGHGSGVGRGLVVGLGPFVFLGMFTYMGVLGANIMRNKSRTQRVTPEFVYVPWTFAGVFWLISGILMGVFLNAVPDVLAPRLAGLRFLHVHAALFGGATLLLLGWAHRILPHDAGRAPPPFHRTRAPFLLLNVALGVALVAALQGASPLLAASAATLLLLVAWVLLALRSCARSPVGAPP